jgi:hypothetical protein
MGIVRHASQPAPPLVEAMELLPGKLKKMRTNIEFLPTKAVG